MSARTIAVEDSTPLLRRGCGVRNSGENLLAYDLAVLVVDVETVVGAAGGWLCDRVRAGWRVTAYTPERIDPKPLTILGVRAVVRDSGIDLVARQRPAALALDARLMAHDDRVRREVLGVADGHLTEVTVWGESPLLASDRRFNPVSHRLSAAARAFKALALAPKPGAVPDLGSETFHSAALWYPPDGTDLAPMSASTTTG